ncbi:MAG: aminopeptidase P family protein [Desulfarculus sp.]|nr:MAG: aminopeptidase P family protein [Desulfarculus sp.]
MNWRFPAWYHLVPAEVIRPRLARIGAMCGQEGLAGVLLTDCRDVFYACGSAQQGVVLVDGAGQATVLMRRHAGRAEAESPLNVTPISGLGQAAGLILERIPAGGRLGLTLDVLSARDYVGWLGRLPGLTLVDATRPWLELKAVKDAWELERMAAAGALAASIYAALPHILRPGLTEAQAAGRMQALAIAGGSTDVLPSRGGYHQPYSWHVTAGPEGVLPSAMDAPFSGWGLSPAFPLGSSHRPLRPGEPIDVDFGVSVEGYQSDQTRTYTLGPAPAPVRAAHDCLQEIEAALLTGLRPGAMSGDLFALAMGIAERRGLGEAFLGRPGRKIRFAAHGVGQELGAPPYILEGSPAKVRAGETYALELKMVLNEGPVGLENTVVVTEGGPARCLVPLASELFELPAGEGSQT